MFQSSLCQTLVISASALITIGAGSLFWLEHTAAQAVQPTGQAAPATQNPQLLPQQELGAPSSNLQGNTGSPAVGLSLNQLPGQTQRISIPKSNNTSSSPRNTVNQPDTADRDASKSWFRNQAIIAAGFLAVILGGLTVLLVRSGTGGS